jgi:hypothetical protein
MWPQGIAAMQAVMNRDSVSVPPELDWNAWLGVAAVRPYIRPYDVGSPSAKFSRGVYHTFNWRGFWDFGGGAFGDMASHVMNLPFRGLELDVVKSAECMSVAEWNNVAFPLQSNMKLVFAARQSRARPGIVLPEVTLHWYDGDQQKNGDPNLARMMPQITALDQYKGKIPRTGCLIIGSRGILCSPADYGQQAFLALEGEHIAKDTREHPACEMIPVTIPRRARMSLAEQHYIEFLDAIRENGPMFPDVGSRCYSDISLSARMADATIIGTIAQRIPGKLCWNSHVRKFDVQDANRLITAEVRKGFEY